ncbi:DNA polymerase III subunit chi [Niveispirillum lacus]|uniref:DNA polymerase III subunit chi n=1 Tax=Niveispirillum lacus TaxID=1981099 RepID=A0A255Z8E6_9PROT|nr:DNA polymerase III subunit chi [Niveispirillum lacus]OYQ37719.1 DNA polymerase III subunit chi [Niveispirillum lacus]
MTERRFYHLTRKTLEQTLPGLLEKSLERGWRVLILTGSGERAEALNQHLWTFRPDSFLPHGTAKDGQVEHQPILIHAVDDGMPERPPNEAHVLFLTDGVDGQGLSGVGLICDLFDGNDPAAVAAARDRWRQAKADGDELTYWQQNETGGWEKKA